MFIINLQHKNLMMFLKFCFCFFSCYFFIPVDCISFIFVDISKFEKTYIKLQHSSLMSNKYVNHAYFNSHSLFGKNINQKEFLKKFNKEEVSSILIKNSNDQIRDKAFQGLESLDPFFSYTFTSIESKGGKYGLLYCDNLKFKISRLDILKNDYLINLDNDNSIIDSVFTGQYYLTKIYRAARSKDLSNRTNGFLSFLNKSKIRDNPRLKILQNSKFIEVIKNVSNCRYYEANLSENLFSISQLDNFFILNSNKDSITFVIPFVLSKYDLNNSSCFLTHSNFSFIPFFICYLNHEINFDSTISCIPDIYFSSNSKLDSVFYLNLLIYEHGGFPLFTFRDKRIKSITKKNLYGLFQDESQDFVFLISDKLLPKGQVDWISTPIHHLKYFEIHLNEFLYIDSNFCIPKSSFGYCNFTPL